MARRNARHFALIPLLALSVFLAGCGKSGTSTSTATGAVTTSGLGVSATEVLAGKDTKTNGDNRPSALLGFFVASYIAERSTAQVYTALIGVEATEILHLGFDPEKQTEDAFTLLQQYGELLQVDLSDLLNRAANRANALNEYVKTLQNATNVGESRQLKVKSELAELQAGRRTIASKESELKRNASKALSDENYAEAGRLQPQLLEAQRELAEADSQIRQRQDQNALFEKLLKIGNERLNAIEKNREALIVGIKIQDAPGVDALGVIDSEKKFGLFGR